MTDPIAPSRIKAAVHVGARDQAWIDEKRRKRMASIDDLPAEIRALVHRYGFHVVNTIMACGVTKERHIRTIVETVLDEFSPTRGSGSAQGRRSWRDGGA